jgi:hypothetical protein
MLQTLRSFVSTLVFRTHAILVSFEFAYLSFLKLTGGDLTHDRISAPPPSALPVFTSTIEKNKIIAAF